MTEPARKEPESQAEALAKTEQAIEKLEPKPAPAIVLASSRVQDVLPQKFYEGASTLELTDKQVEALQEFEDAPAEEWDIRPDGLVYVSHMWYRKALNRIFGPGRWSMMPGSPIQDHRDGDRIQLFQRWVLVVNQHYVGEAIGSASYWANNAKQDISDAAESAASNAIMRICAKSLGIGSNPWNRREAQKWRKEWAKQVWVQERQGRVKRWRRVDADPLPDEISDAPRPAVQAPHKEEVIQPETGRVAPKPGLAPAPATPAGSEHLLTARTPKPVAPVQAPAPAASAKPASEPAPVKPTAPPAPEKPPEAKPDAGNLVTEGQVRLFIADARRRQLIRGEDAGTAWAFLQDQMPEAKETPGKTHMENLLANLRKATKEQFNQVILPALRELGG